MSFPAPPPEVRDFVDDDEDDRDVIYDKEYDDEVLPTPPPIPFDGVRKV